MDFSNLDQICDNLFPDGIMPNFETTDSVLLPPQAVVLQPPQVSNPGMMSCHPASYHAVPPGEGVTHITNGISMLRLSPISPSYNPVPIHVPIPGHTYWTIFAELTRKGYSSTYINQLISNACSRNQEQVLTLVDLLARMAQPTPPYGM